MEKQTMGKFIAALRKANGMTQTDLADKLGVTNKSVSKWECDEGYPDLSLIPVIAEIFSVTTDEILKGSRIAKSETGAAPETVKTEKQVNRLVQKTLTRFKNMSLLAAIFGILGIIFIALPVVILSSQGFMDTNLYYFCLIFSAVLFIADIIIQAIFMNNAKAALYDSDLAEDYEIPLLTASRYINNVSFYILSISLFAFVSGFLSLLSTVPPYVILLVAAPLFLLLVIIKSALETNKYYNTQDNGELSKNLKKLKSVCAIIVAVSFFAPFIIYVVLSIISLHSGTYFEPAELAPAVFYAVSIVTGIVYLLKRKQYLKPYRKF